MALSLPLIVIGLVVAVVGFVVNSGLVTLVGCLVIAAGVLLFLAKGQRTRSSAEHRH